MKHLRLGFIAPILVVVLLSSGCGSNDVEVNSRDQKEAANLVSEAQFALQLRDSARAEGLLTKATKLDPTVPDMWLMLGACRKRLGNSGGAKQAYKEALSAQERLAKKEPTLGDPRLGQVYIHALLGDEPAARKALDKAAKDLPNDRSIRQFIADKALDRMLTDPGFKENAL